MYPMNMDSVHSGTSVFYQAMPGFGADGKKIMKLIPVRMVDGQFAQSAIPKPSVDFTIKKAANVSSAPVVLKKIITSPGSFLNVLPNPERLDPGNSLNNHPQQQQTESLLSKVQTTATPATNCVHSVRPPWPDPVMVKSPALPRGHFLQIPPKSHVRTLPASELPPGIKKQIYNSSADSTPRPDVPSGVFVSPVNTVSQCAAPPCDSGPHLPGLPSQTESTAKTLKPLLKLIPKAWQGPKGPSRWIIEEDYHSVTSKIIRTVPQREKNAQHYGVSESNLDKSGPEQKNGLIVWKGKVFFGAKKCCLLSEKGDNDSPTTKCSEIRETTEPSFHHPVEPAAAQTQQGSCIIIPDEPDEVIDLCDDDTQDDSQQAALANTSAVSHQDDDNIIFVSYVPPNVDAELTVDLRAKTQTTREKDRDLLSSLDRRGEGSTLTGGRSGTVGNVTHVCASAGTRVRDDEGSNVNRKHSTSSRQEGSVGGGVDPETPADDGSAACSHKQDEALPGCRKSSPAPPPCKMADRQLSRMFGITVDVKICLQRIDEARAGLAEARSSEFINSAEDWHEPACELKEKDLFLPDGSCKSQNDDMKRLVTECEQSADAATATAHTDVTSLECDVFKLNTKHLSDFGRSTCGVENTTLIGYLEPIDEDFLSENEIAESQDVVTQRQAQTCVDLNTNTSRMGRTRKRTMCPCCTPGTPEPAVKSSARSEELEKWACRTADQ